MYRVNGVALHAELRGQGPPLVYVHGGFASLGSALRTRSPQDRNWLDALTPRLRLICYDRRGCGRSAVPSGGYDPHTQAGDLLGLLDALHLEQVHLFASSAGGPIAVLAAVAQPSRVRSLTIHGSARRIVRPGDGVCEAVRAAYALLETADAEVAFDQRPAGVEVWFESPWARRQAQADGRLPDYLAEEHALCQQAAALPRAERVWRYAAEVRNIRAYDGFDVGPYAARLSVPTLILHGSNDQVFPPSEGRALAEAIPEARFVLVEGAGHGPVFTHDAARAQMYEFITSHDR